MRRTVVRLADGRELIHFDHDGAPERTVSTRRCGWSTVPRAACTAATRAQMMPDLSALISFMTFMASMMQSVCPTETVEPTSTKFGASGAGFR